MTTELAELTDDDVLALTMLENDKGAGTVGDYLLMVNLRDDSDARFEVYAALIFGRAVQGSFGRDGMIDFVDSERADAIIQGAQKRLAEGDV